MPFSKFCGVLILMIIINATIIFAEDSSSNDCSVTNTTSKKRFDLSPLKKASGSDWVLKSHEYTFYINVCDKILHEVNGVDTEEIGVWGKKDGHDSGLKLGNFNKNPHLNDDDVYLEYVGGKCGTDSIKYTSVIYFKCDQTVEGQGEPRLIYNYEDCAFVFEWKTPVACPTSVNGGAMSSWGVFFTIFAIALIVYFLGGIAYNRMVHRASGFYQIPNWEFWCNLWDFTKDMVLIIIAQIPMFKPRRPRGNYKEV
ncbi:9850_t:CDS:2 [Diversispora eburnea]|uniref:9850_t:CDS:1 n=1 Tax=Diversispora eburnea TaxID=1213867 RepID=A0A9N9FF92_9GLOM|nr:9850_t:CDS:2 [Diversispora eburnea]